MAQSGKLPAAAMAVRRRERRRLERLPVRVRVLMRTSAGDVPLVTENLDRGGFFLRTESPRPERDLVELVVDLGPMGLLEMVCVVRRAVTREEGEANGWVPGMVVQLYGTSRGARERWDRFVAGLEREELLRTGDDSSSGARSAAGQRAPSGARPLTPVPEAPSVRATRPALPQLSLDALQEAPPQPGARFWDGVPRGTRLEVPGAEPRPVPTALHGPPSRSLRPVTPAPGVSWPAGPSLQEGALRVVVFNISLPTQRKLDAFLVRLLENRPIPLPAERPLERNQPVRVLLVHPESEQTFPLLGRVSGNLTGSNNQLRVAVTFEDVPDRWLQRLTDFVRTGVGAELAELEAS
jgi:hypothetical protein